MDASGLNSRSLSVNRIAATAVTMIGALVLSALFYVSASGRENMEENWKDAKSIYDFEAIDIDGNNVTLDKYRGHVCIIVNVATK